LGTEGIGGNGGKWRREKGRGLMPTEKPTEDGRETGHDERDRPEDPEA